MNHINRRKAATLFVITALFASILAIPTAQAAVTPFATAPGTIVFDYSHGQESSSGTVAALDAFLEANLTAMGFDVVWARGGINATILTDAVAFVAGSIYGAGNGYLAAEITAIDEWFNAGNKFMWIGYDSDYTSAPDQGQMNNDNMTLILEAVGSHVYGEPAAIEDPISSCGSGYRAIANTTTTNLDLAAFVQGVTGVMMHGPTLLYGSEAGAWNTSAVALETTEIDNVYPLLYYGGNATIMNGDLIDPIAHDEGDVGSFVATTLELNAGTDGSSALVVSGASPYGDYRPMFTDLYYNVTMDGNNFVKNTLKYGVFAATATQGEGKIVFDYSHGQKSSSGTVAALDAGLRTALFLKGYDTYWALGGINATILEDAVAFIAGSIYGAGNAYLAAEITAIGDWFNAGNKFMWIGYDSDYTSAPDQGQFNNDNMTLILEEVGSQVFGEPAAIEDPVSSCGSGYRAIANTTSDDAFVADLVVGVTQVMMHGPTLLYGVNGTGAFDLETNSFTDVYPVLYYGANATIMNGDLIDPIAHDEGDVGSFVAMTLEDNAGTAGTGILVVSGASPYGDYRPMYTDLYYGYEMDGHNLVLNTIDFGIANVAATGFVLDTTTLLIIGGVAVVIIIIIIVIKKR
ncbi:MAG: hypothetical protein ACTSYJ_01170 [Candidatus Thorarchaeota archaeon]